VFDYGACPLGMDLVVKCHGQHEQKTTMQSQSRDQLVERIAVVLPFPVPCSDAGLVAALRVDHPGARRALCDRYSGELLEVATRILGPDARVESIVIETLRWSLSRLDELADPRSFRTWLLSRLVVLAMQGVHARRPWRWFRGAKAHELEDGCCSEQLVSTYCLLDRMAIDERVVFCLVVIHSMGLAEVAAILGTSFLTIKDTLAAAHTRFDRLIQTRDPRLAHWYSSHALLGVEVAQEQDQLLNCGQIFNFDLLKERNRIQQRSLVPIKRRVWVLALALLVAFASVTTAWVAYFQRV
jgi:DNA-directed RNA polymerase specialized sigma24 family protein